MKPFSYAAVAAAFLISGTAHAATTGYLKIGDIKGETAATEGSSAPTVAPILIEATRVSDEPARASGSDSDKDEPVQDVATPDPPTDLSHPHSSRSMA